MQLRQIMSREFVRVDMDTTLEEVRDLFNDRHFHHLLVTESGLLRGIVSDRDLLRHISPFIGNTWAERTQDVNTLKKRVHQIMTRQVITASSQMTFCDAAALLVFHNISCLPIVTDEDRIVGIVTWKDLLRTACNLPEPELPETDGPEDEAPGQSDEAPIRLAG